MTFGKLSPQPIRLREWRTSLIMAMVTSDDIGIRSDLSEMLVAVLDVLDDLK